MLAEQQEIFGDAAEATDEGDQKEVEALQDDYAEWVEDEFPEFQEQIEEMGE
jgi:hypothetical protein